MGRPRKNVVKVTYTLDKEITDLINKYNAETNIPKSKIIEQSVKNYVGRRIAEHETKYGRVEGESFGWNDN